MIYKIESAIENVEFAALRLIERSEEIADATSPFSRESARRALLRAGREYARSIAALLRARK